MSDYGELEEIELEDEVIPPAPRKRAAQANGRGKKAARGSKRTKKYARINVVQNFCHLLIRFFL